MNELCQNEIIVCVAGKNKIAIDACKFLLRNGFGRENLFICCNSTDNGLNGWQPSLRHFATLQGLKVVKLDELYPLDNLIFFSLEFDRIIRPKHFASKELFNIHFSKLPAYKGMFTSVHPLLNSELDSGVTLHRIDRGIDTGDVIAQRSFVITPRMRAIDLYHQYLYEALQLFESNFFDLVNRNYASYPQSASGSSYFSKDSLRFSNPTVDFNATAFQIERWIRAFNFRPFQLPTFGDTSISHAKILPDLSLHKPGEFQWAPGRNFVDVTTVDYVIRLFPDQLCSIIESARNNDVGRLELFNSMGYAMDDWEEHGWTPLIVAAYHGSQNALKYLISLGVNINHQNINGTTVLMYAFTYGITSGNFQGFDFLLESGANPEIKDYRGFSLMDYVYKNANEEMIGLIKNKLIAPRNEVYGNGLSS